MMRSSRPLLARSNMAAATVTPPSHLKNTQAGPIPSIRLISATPSAAGDDTTSFNRSLEESWEDMASQHSVLAPKSDAAAARKKLVPKKSKLSILTIGRDKDKDRGKDFSDVVRRIGAPASASGRDGFEIYVDPTIDPDIGEIVMVKKKKSRAALDGMNWGTLGDATNVPKTTQVETTHIKTKENPAMLKVKVEEERKWWSIGRGRKDSKEKSSKDKENKMSVNAQPVEYVHKPTERSKTPEPLKATQEFRGRFNSLDAGILLGASSTKHESTLRWNNPPTRAQTPTFQFSEPEPEIIPERARSATPSAGLFFRSATPTLGGLLVPPGQKQGEEKQGSIAVRAMRSMRSLARMGSWAQLKGMSQPTAQEMAEEMQKVDSEGEKRKEKKVKEKKKDGTAKDKKNKKTEEVGEKKKKSKKDKIEVDGSGTIKKKSAKKEKSQTPKLSTSSFEVGHLSASPEATATLGTKKHSILGLGLPSTMRLPRMRGGSTASSVNLNSTAHANPGVPPASAGNSVQTPPNLLAPLANRLSAENVNSARPSSVASSNGPSLRPASLTSTNSRLSTGSSVISGNSGASVRWDEEGLETVREQRKREREERRVSEDTASSGEKAERRTSRESRRSSEGRRRTPLSSVFPEAHHHQVGVAMLQDVTEEEPKVVQDVGSVSVSDSDGGSMHSVNTTTSSMCIRRRSYGAFPILTIEEATSDGHEGPEDDEECTAATPMKNTRARPMSEQLLGRARPQAIHEDDEGVLSILSAATNDLALLINNLDLQATPSTPDMTPLKASVVKDEPGSTGTQVGKPGADSPLKKTLKRQFSSLASLRPYAQSRGYNAKPTTSSSSTSTTIVLPAPTNTVTQAKSAASLIGQQIAPWPVLIAAVSPTKEMFEEPAPATTSNATPPTSMFKPGHKRTMTPAPEPEPEPVFQPLKPARSRVPLALVTSTTTICPAKSDSHLPVDVEMKNTGLHSSCTFGPSRGSMTIDDLSSSTGGSGSLTPVFKRIQELEDEIKRASLCPADYRGRCDSKSRLSDEGMSDSFADSFSVPIAREARRTLGRTGTLGGSDRSHCEGPELDASDPDSDVPDELKFILASHSDRGSIAESLTFRDEQNVPTSSLASELSASTTESLGCVPNGPPSLPLPSFRLTLVDGDQNQSEIEGELAHSSDEDTKKSFDFTGEIQKLNESGGSDRASFVEQLEMAFKTPAKVDLRYDFGTHLQVEAPPVPALPLELGIKVSSSDNSTSSSSFDCPPHSPLLDVKEPTILEKTQDETFSQDAPYSGFDDYSTSRIADIKEPTLLHNLPSDVTDGTPSEEQTNSSIELARSTGSTSSRSDGELDRSFRFGGLPKNSLPNEEKPLTLSDIIPPPDCARVISEASMLDDLEDDSVLRSIYAKLMGKQEAVDLCPPVGFTSFENDNNVVKGVSRPTSGISFAGLESFDEVRRGFEFSGDRSFYPPPARNNRRVPHHRDESVFSIASVSSYGRVINNGVNDPFDYGLPSLQERPSSEDISSISMSISVEDTFAFIHNQPRRRVESDASSFYFQASDPVARGHGRRESNISVTSQAPPISLYNRSLAHHRRNDSSTSSSSVAISYARHGANSGISAWARHRKDQSIDSVMSEFSAMHLGRPGIGDKMFDHAVDLGPLTSISASPPEKVHVSESNHNHASYDSIIDEEQRSSMEDSLFEKTGHCTSVSSDSVFGDDYPGLLRPEQFRPLSVLSVGSVHSPAHEDDTMISMLGGGHVRRCSLVSMMEASPCIRIEKRKHAAIQETKFYKKVERHESPYKARIVEKPSIASSFQFGSERMIKAQQGLLERQSLEENCFMADGEDISGFCMPVFTRPLPAGSRSSTCTSSSGADTPPLSASDGSSNSGGSQSSIDLSQLNVVLANATHPLPITARTRARARARGNGHRRRYSKAHVSRSSVYETIEEEGAAASPAQSVASKKDDPTTRQPVFIVDADTASIHSKIEDSFWDDKRGIVALRKFYALRDEAEDTVSESKRIWLDTPFSIFAVQSFQPPHHPAGMQALLEHSVQSYGPLPSELRPRRIRSRTSSRPSPYPSSRISKSSLAAETSKERTNDTLPSTTSVLRQLVVSPNASSPPTLVALKPFSPLVIDNNVKSENIAKNDKAPPHGRPRVGSTARRTALGWSKRSNGKSSTDQKENIIGNKNLVATGTTTTPSDTLRLSRPRPKGRTPAGRTPATQKRLIRI